MSKSALVARLLPGLAVAVLMTLSWIAPVRLPISSLNVSVCGSGAGGAPSVTGISPTSGATLGGTTVTVTGCAFTGATGVKFGTTAATGVTVNSDTSITATSPAHAAGVVDVTVTSALGTSATSAADNFTFTTTCVAVSLSAAPASPQRSGTQIVFTATSTCPSASPLYEFWMRAASQPDWVMIQSYGTSNTYNWNSTGAAPGIVYFGVWVKDAASQTTTFDRNTSIAFTVNASCTLSVAAAPNPVVEGSGTHSIITATATCVHPNPLFEFWMRAASQPDWVMIQGYGTSNTYNWNSTGAAPGIVYFGVWVKDALSATATFDANASIPVTVTPAKCTGVTASAAPTTVVHGAGTHVIVTGAATGCTNASPLYEFWLRTTNTDWQLVQGYGTAATYDWNSTGAPITTVYIGVWAKDAKSSTGTFDANVSVTIPVT